MEALILFSGLCIIGLGFLIYAVYLNKKVKKHQE